MLYSVSLCEYSTGHLSILAVGHLGCFTLLVTIHKAVMNIHSHIYVYKRIVGDVNTKSWRGCAASGTTTLLQGCKPVHHSGTAW